MKSFSVLWLLCGTALGSIYHEGSRTILFPNGPANYFGYSVLFRDTKPPQLVVGAPTAPSTHAAHAGLGRTGAVYTCDLTLGTGPSNITCGSLEFDTEGNTRSSKGLSVHHYKNEMWLGATLADVHNGSLVVCAPRWANQVEAPQASHRLVNGICYAISSRGAALLVPMVDLSRQASFARGDRPEYGPDGTNLNFYAYAQAGFSARVSPDQDWLLLGAPGLLQWTGGIAKYGLTRRSEGDTYFANYRTTNPYFTKELGPDSYFGYSVDAGVFESGGATLGVGGAPRGNRGLGEVLIFELKGAENAPMGVKASVFGTQLGEYFGGTVLVVDINADGRADLLVGAPLHVERSAEHMPYDQGMVYVYLNKPTKLSFKLELVGKLTGSALSGARFGSAIADLGDVDDGDSSSFPEIAIGAPWENNGRGAVYIYKSNSKGINPVYAQKISPEEYRGFSISIARGLDVDGNGCNELAVGAFDSGAAVLYRCIRTVHVKAEIQVPGAVDLPEDATNFTANFCVNVAKSRLHSKYLTPVCVEVIVTLSVDIGGGRASLSGDTTYSISLEQGSNHCKEQLVVIQPNVDLSRPITLMMEVKEHPFKSVDEKTFYPDAGRLGLGLPSQLSHTMDVQLTRNCGEDLICKPDLKVTFVSLSSSPFVPGSGDSLGAEVRVKNTGEPAYRSCVKIYVPVSLLRVPSGCRLQGMELACELPRPFYRNKAKWIFELDHSQVAVAEQVLEINASTVHSTCEDINSTVTNKETFLMHVKPQTNVTALGRPLPNATITVSREKFSKGSYFEFAHFYAISNFGPSDLPSLEVDFEISPHVELVDLATGCVRISNQRVSCAWTLRAHKQHTALLHLRLRLQEHGDGLEQEQGLQVSTIAYVKNDNTTVAVESWLVLEPRAPVWPIVAAALVGLALVAAIVFVLYKAGFFWRTLRERMQRLEAADLTRIRTPGSMEDVLIDKADDAEPDIEEHSREPSPLSNFYAIQ